MKASTGASSGRTERGVIPPLLRLSGTGRVWLLNVVIAGLAGLLVAAVSAAGLDSVDNPFEIPWWGIAGLFFLAEVYVVHLQFRREAHSFSLSEIPLVLGLYFLAPPALVLAQLVGSGAALILHRRQSPLKLVFNLAHLSFEAIFAALLFHWVVGNGDPAGLIGWIATVVAVALTTVLAAVMITIAISLSEGKLHLETLTEGLGLGVMVGMTNTCIALVAATLMWARPEAAWLLLVPVATVFFAYRAYTSERQKHKSLESLYESSRVVQGSLQIETAISELLSQARKMFQAEVAQITFFPGAGESAYRSSMGPGEESYFMRELELDPRDGVWARVASEGDALLIPKPILNENIRRHFEARGMRDAIVAPLHGADGVIGTFAVGSRLGDVSTFDEADLKLFETLANHASVSLENARLVGRLEESLAHLTEMNRLKDDFVAAVSHELRTPLTSIQGYIKTLLRPNVEFSPGDQRSFIEAVDRQSERLRRLIEDLLVVSRIESDSDKLLVTPVLLQKVARHVVDEFRARTANRSFDFRFDQNLLEVDTDETKVHQVVSNFVDNALKYAPDGTTITIGGRVEGDHVVMSVADEGPGIPEFEQARIFDRFYQIDQSSTRA
ncbi:MAG TPA: histidine kinase dimerization/phospho-acceptor domain-containing protein, partial [Actinomycetota bacterium]|nr:histidine kinase dimerization/phospho-acceptor domain-containing protein [Actinomycetota bacterium]